MYQANIHNQFFSAALPLKPLTAWAGSACSVTVAVPCAPALAGLVVSSVGVTLTLPDGHTVVAAAVQVPGTPLWVATFAPENFATSGHVAQGLMITLAGTDEHEVVRTWIVAKGDVDVMDGDAAPVSGGSFYAVKLRDAAPDDPVEGDAYVSDGALLIYHDGEWVTIGGVDISGKMDGEAAYPAWERNPVAPYPHGYVVYHNGRLWEAGEDVGDDEPGETESWAATTIKDLKQDALLSAQLAAVNSGATAEKVTAWDSYAAQIAAKANTSDVNEALAQKASLSDLPYRLVEPGKWEFSGVPSGMTDVEVSYDSGLELWVLSYELDGGEGSSAKHGDGTELTVEFADYEETWHITATRASLPGHLLDRVHNAVEVTGATTLTLPAAITGYARDFYVRLTVSAAGAGSAVTWTIAQGETWDATGAPPSSFAEGTHLYRITEVAPGVWHAEDMFAVAGKMPMYQMVAVTPTNGTLTVAPYTVATYTADTSAAAFTVAVGTGTAGTARDCELVIDCTATGAVAPTVTWPATFHPRTDAATDFACEAGVRKVYFISEFSSGEFAVGGWQETAGGNA